MPAAATAGRSGLSRHRPEGDRITAFVHGRNAVLPAFAGFAVNQVKRARFGIEREALPSAAPAAAKAESAGAAERQAEDLVEMRLVAMPADADADIVVRAEHLPHACLRQIAEAFDRPRDRLEPVRDRVALFKLLQRVVVAEAERLDPPVAFEHTELERF